MSYWVNGVLLTAAFVIVAVAFAHPQVVARLESPTTALTITGLMAFGQLISVWQLVRIWRAADRHVSRGGRRFWAGAAKVMVLLGALRAVVNLANEEVPTVVNAWRNAAVMAGMPAASVVTMRRGTEIEFAGGIRPGAADMLERVLATTPNARVLHLSSPGGICLRLRQCLMSLLDAG